MVKYFKLFSTALLFLVAFSWGGSLFAQIALNEGVVACYPFNGNAKDESGNGWDLEVHGCSFINGKFDKCIHFENNNNTSLFQTKDWCSSPRAITLNDFTISCWLQSFQTNNAEQHEETIFSIGDHHADFFAIWIQNNIDNSINVGVYKNGIDIRENEQRIKIDFSKWYLLSITKTGKNVYVYLDGVIKQTIELKEDIVYNNLRYHFAYYEWYNGGASASRFYGNLDNAVLYNRALNAGEIKALYEEQGSPCAIPLPLKYTLTLNAIPSGIGTLKGAGEYDNGTKVIITATAKDCYHFVRWTDLAGNTKSTKAIDTIIISKDTTLIAVFEKNKVDVNLTDGYLTIGICENGDGRLVSMSEFASGIFVDENPVSEILKVTCNAIERGNYTLEIIDVLGNSEIVKIFSVDAKNVLPLQFEIPISKFSNGNYIIIMTAPNDKHSAKFSIVK
jgi:hypothetical protein